MSLEMPPSIPNSYLSPVDAGLIAHPDAFVTIDDLDSFRARMRPESGIHFFEHDGLINCRYTIAIPEVFQTAWDLESRGLIFDAKTGEILSRPLHKFFNMGERAGLEDIDFSGGWRADEKLDGSMIGAFVYKGKVVFHTRGGVSSHALIARAAASREVLSLALAAHEMGATPIFEYTAPDNRVVISYDRAALTLLALRDIRTGIYLDPEPLARAHGVEIAKPIATGINSAQDFLDLYAEIVPRTDIEGIVLIGPNGRRIKVKTQDYLRRHKILANLGNERYAYQAWLDDVVDDTAAALGGARGDRLKAFETAIEKRIIDLTAEVEEVAKTIDTSDRRAAAKQVTTRFNGAQQSLVFGAIDGADIRDRVRQILAKRISSADKRSLIKAEFGLPDWQPIHLISD